MSPLTPQLCVAFWKRSLFGSSRTIFVLQIVPVIASDRARFARPSFNSTPGQRPGYGEGIQSNRLSVCPWIASSLRSSQWRRRRPS